MRLVYDIGMYDGQDTRYYLEQGWRVVAVEANPALVERAQKRFAEALRQSRLELVNAAVVEESGKAVELTVCGDDLGASSIAKERIEARVPIGSYAVVGITLPELFAKHGVPYYMKVDIEGADRWCVKPLTSSTRPSYLSFEVGDDFEELVEHAESVGYRRFKLINQCNFRELSNQKRFADRVAHKLMHWMGFKEPLYVKRCGRYFQVMHSAGPAPWVSDGRWCGAAEARRKWERARARDALGGWYDVHATCI